MSTARFLHFFGKQMKRRIHFLPKRYNSSIGFIGLGQMGARMANNLIKKSGKSVIVYDKFPKVCEDAVKNGAKLAKNVSDLAKESNIIITMLRSDDQVLEVYDTIYENINDNTLLIDSSTVYYETSQLIETKYLLLNKEKNISMVVAPVSGGITAAEAASLTFMCGGLDQSYNLAKPILDLMGAKIFHCGEQIGSGQIAKCCNNLILAISMCAVSEGINLGNKLGLNPNKLSEIVNVSSGRCWSSDTYNPCPGIMPNIPSSNQYNGGFVVDLMRKDLSLALKAAQSVNANVPLGSNVSQLYDMIANRGFGNKDFGFIYQFIKAHEQDIDNYTP